MATSYWDYIRVGDLLRLQGGRDDDEASLANEEVLFIVVHQVYELWFKLVLRELDTLARLLAADPVPESAVADAVAGLDRCTRILRVAVQHWEVVESLGTRDYLAFRDKLFPASGFQSAQLREIEIVLGLDADEREPFGEHKDAWLQALREPGGRKGEAWERVQARLAGGPSVREALDAWLYRTPIRGSRPGEPNDETVVGGFLEDYLSCHAATAARIASEWASTTGIEPATLAARHDRELAAAREFLLPDDRRRRRIRAAMLFIESYRELPLLAWPRRLLGSLVEMEQGFTVFRQRHARMVERVIGRRVGTGGSLGVDYLDKTALSYRVFRDLWTLRTFQLSARDLPPLADPSPYDFASPT